MFRYLWSLGHLQPPSGWGELHESGIKLLCRLVGPSRPHLLRTGSMVPDVQNLSPEEENRPVLQCCGREHTGEQHFDLGIPGLGKAIPEWGQMAMRPKTMASSGSQVCPWLPAHPSGLRPALSLPLPTGSREAPSTCSLMHLPFMSPPGSPPAESPQPVSSTRPW